MTSLWQLKRFEARISLFKSLDCPLALAAAGMNQRFTRYPPVINHNLGWCNCPYVRLGESSVAQTSKQASKQASEPASQTDRPTDRQTERQRLTYCTLFSSLYYFYTKPTSSLLSRWWCIQHGGNPARPERGPSQEGFPKRIALARFEWFFHYSADVVQRKLQN